MPIRKKIALLAISLVIAACSGGGGQLQSIIEDGGETYGFGDFSNGTDKSFGVFICVDGGSATIESVESLHAEGEIEYLGAVVYTSEDRFVGAANGFPPDGIDEAKIEPAEGAVVTAACSGGDSEKVQLLVGAERTGSGGGVLDGFLVTTDTGELEIDLTILLCGDELEYCEALIPAEGTTTTSP
jgi:hypothetical protein